MQYLKLTSGPTIIEFHNSWLGEETITVNNKIVSKKASIYGAQHYFTVTEKSDQVNYLLISKVSGSSLDVFIDLFRDGVPVHIDIPLPFATKPKTPSNEAKMEGLNKMKEYDMIGALEAFKKSLTYDPNDAESYLIWHVYIQIWNKRRMLFLVCGMQYQKD
ncbi:MAG: hypothetical protein IPO92_04160 [Saprospiraceae bacterium]|nr:hypothetical protein [Saprospiraceae bacterium]